MSVKLRGAAVMLILASFLANSVTAAYAQDARRGEHVFRKCLLCHVVEPGTTSSIAPPLHDIVGRHAGSIKGFQYSEIMQLARDKGLTWSEDALYQFLDKPEDFMPGTYMAFAGLEEQERRDVIAFLKHLTEQSKFKTEVKPQIRPQGSIDKPAPTASPLTAAPGGLGSAARGGAETASPAYVPNVPPAMLQPKPAATRRPERQPERPKRPPQNADKPQ